MRNKQSHHRTVAPSHADKGMSLIEATVILGVVSMLTAVLAPSVRTYVNSAQQSAAKEDVEMIGSALGRFLADVGEGWVLRDGRRDQSNGSSTNHFTPVHTAANRVDLLVSDGNTPAVQTVRSASGTPDWDTAVNLATPTTVQKLEWFLATNTPSNTSTNAYRTGSTMDGTGNFDPDAGRQYNAPYAWRGAYLPGPITADPWGNRYAVNVEYLASALGAGPAGNVNDVLVISAGSNGLIETRYDTDGATHANDIVYVFAGGSR